MDHGCKRTVEGMMKDIFNTPIRLCSIPGCEKVVSQALSEPTEEAKEYVQKQEVLYADETGWREANQKAWLWTAVTKAVTVFMIHARRGQEAAENLLGRFAGILGSDRWSASNIYKGIRQLCWSHLKRDFEGFTEYSGNAKKIGKQLLAKVELMFYWWYRVRDETLSRQPFQNCMKPLRIEVEELLKKRASCGHKKMGSYL
ncbi:MAG: transposase [bacterium]